jgi:formate dehydrogenase major subunit
MHLNGLTNMMKPLLNTPPDTTPDISITVDGQSVAARCGELLIEALNRHAQSHAAKAVPQVCYLPQMGPIQSCDTCMVEVNGSLVRACGTRRIWQ